MAELEIHMGVLWVLWQLSTLLVTEINRSHKEHLYCHISDLLSSFMIDLQSAFSVPTTAINDYVLQAVVIVRTHNPS